MGAVDTVLGRIRIQVFYTHLQCVQISISFQRGQIEGVDHVRQQAVFLDAGQFASRHKNQEVKLVMRIHIVPSFSCKRPQTVHGGYRLPL